MSDGDVSCREKLSRRRGTVNVTFLLLVKSGLPNFVSFSFVFYKFLFLLNKGNK